jgi:sugar fermentation stimulation protein A
MRLSDNLVLGRFVRRLNRFLVEVEAGGDVHQAHLPNAGRLNELLRAGAPAALCPVLKTGRRTRFDMAMVESGGVWVSCDARLPAALVVEALEKGGIPGFEGYSRWRREIPFHTSRFDLLLSGVRGLCIVECKSVTLVVDGAALFPDAPTQRGERHLRTLARAPRQGLEAAIVFVVQRPDAESLRPNREDDERFAAAYEAAHKSGVKLLACCCETSFGEISIVRQIPVAIP